MKQRTFNNPTLFVWAGTAIGAGMFVFWLRRRLANQAEEQPGSVVETIVATLSDAPPTTPIAAAMQSALAQNAAEVETSNAATATATATGFVGNRKTLIYHLPTSANLPAEENRQYFANETDARNAGFRRAENE